MCVKTVKIETEVSYKPENVSNLRNVSLYLHYIYAKETVTRHGISFAHLCRKKFQRSFMFPSLPKPFSFPSTNSEMLTINYIKTLRFK